MLTGVSGRIDDAIERFKSGKLVDEADTGVVPRTRSEPGMGSGMGCGRGMGMGRGMGRGMGCGGGRGMGRGSGRSGAVGRRSSRDWESEPWKGQADAQGGREDIAFLKKQAEALAEELGKIQQRIEQMEKK